MRVHEVSPEELDFVSAVCLDPSIPPKWREAMKPCMEARKDWLKNMMSKGLRILVALEKPEVVINSLGAKNARFKGMAVRGEFPKGLLEFVPIEYALEPVKGEKSLFIDCLWVVPPFWHSNVARALMEKFIEEAKAYGSASVLAYEGDKWFGFFPYMPASFFRKFGFEEVDRDGSRVLLYLNFGANEEPMLIRTKKRTVKSDKTVVDVFFNSQCPWSGWMVDKIERNMKKYDVLVNLINTDDRKIVEEHGMSRGVCINGVPMVKRMASWKEVESAVKKMPLRKK
jgi:GNAT superfamily N-acetyltransferase